MVSSASLTSSTTIGGNTVWHQGNVGKNSGLVASNADQVDGKDANQIIGGAFIQNDDFSDITEYTGDDSGGNPLLDISGSGKLLGGEIISDYDDSGVYITVDGVQNELPLVSLNDDPHRVLPPVSFSSSLEVRYNAGTTTDQWVGYAIVKMG